MFSREQKQQQLEKAEKKLIKLEELQSNFVNAIENRLQKTKRSSKRKLESADWTGFKRLLAENHRAKKYLKP